MAAKLCLLAAVALCFSAHAINVVNSGQNSGNAIQENTQLLDLEKMLWKLAPKAAGDLEKDLKTVQESAPDTQTLKDEVTDLVLSKAQMAFGATPFGDSVKRIIALIEDHMFPKIRDAHKADQEELDHLSESLSMCSVTKGAMVGIADKSKNKYLKFSPLHKTCRTGQAGLLTSKQEACSEMVDKKSFMELKWTAFDLIDKRLKDQESNKQIMQKEGSESTESYINRISETICGQDTKCDSGGDDDEDGDSHAAAHCGTPQCGFRCQFQCAKSAYENAEADWNTWKEKCAKIQKQFDAKVIECDNLQDQMDAGACKRAVDMKDACETYAECYTSKKQAYDEAMHVVMPDEKDRKHEWEGLKRMQCLLQAFTDGKVDDTEIEKCQKQEHSVDIITIKYPELIKLEDCEVPKAYPTTGEYKKLEFAPLPALAKGKEDANECTGVMEISLIPDAGSPAGCECERVTLNGPYSPGPMVKCHGCLDVRKSTDHNSCPAGTKIWAPRSREDWKTFLASAEPLRDPHWIIDVSRPQNGCGGCAGEAMNSGNAMQFQDGSGWVTQDESPWWLRSTGLESQTSDYHANCFMDLFPADGPQPLAGDEDKITWKESNCDYHSKSYYCQLESVLVVPKAGSPRGCRCKKVELTGIYSPGILIKCMGCLDVYKSTQKNSCPTGSKIFAPRTREDWKVFIDSATPLRNPNWIVDVTRPANGCGGCSDASMNSDNLAQKTWRTSDGSAWWLRSTTYTEPSGDYEANCYLDLWHNPENENSVAFNDMSCNYHSNSYYCQLAKKEEKVVAPVEHVA